MTPTQLIPQNKIKHLSISGGATWGIHALGMMIHAIQTGFVDMKEIQSVYATSVGTVVSAMLLLNIDFDVLTNYLIKRPWHRIYTLNINTIVDSYQKKGMFDRKLLEELFSSLLKSVDLSTNITLQQFYEYTGGVDFHIYTTELNRFELIDMSYRTHPDWLLLDAIYASCTIPNLFSPIFRENGCYLDGGIFLNDPISKCIQYVVENGGNIDEILSISIDMKNKGDMNNNWFINSDTNLFDFNRILIRKLLHEIQLKCPIEIEPKLLYKIQTECNTNTMDDIISIMNSSDIRKRLLEEGIEKMREFLDLIDSLHCIDKFS